MPRPPLVLISLLLTLFTPTLAQFGFFDQMFGGGGGGGGNGGGGGGHHQHQEAQNVRSDASWYQAQYEGGT